ncbi:ZnF-CDGSH domain-containing protein [Aphelenchoides bicaudatus]|nr:ZnF-CDGSH domain-containing protein [Aphelenchoides bicaudatus]
MGLTGFLLLAARSTWTKLEDDVDYFFNQEPILDSVHSAHPVEMSCSHAGSNCHAKLALYAAGLLVGGAAIGYLIGTKVKKARCNNKIKLDSDKVVDSQDIEDIGEKKAYCRCWKSSKFPYCDGSHNNHNKQTGDNVGPLIVSNSHKAAL